MFEVKKLFKKLHPFWKLVFIMLSSRTKDEATLKALKKLLKKLKNCKELAKTKTEEIEELIYGVGFYKQKAKKLKKMAEMLAVKNCNPPEKFEELVKLPGVGEKTANVFLSEKNKAIGVDVHVHRISNRLGWVKTNSPSKTEKELREKIPQNKWEEINTTLVAFGQTICKSKPRCWECSLQSKCLYFKNSKAHRP